MGYNIGKSAQVKRVNMNENNQSLPEDMSEGTGTGCTDTSCCPPKGIPTTRATPKIGRNDPCICGNGRKYKKCCGKNL